MNPELRNEFPELKDIVYLNNAAISLLPIRSREALMECLKDREYTGEKRTDIRNERDRRTRQNIGELINASYRDICLVSNTSEGLNIVAQGLDLKETENVVIAKHGFPGNAVPWLNLRKKGVTIKIVDSEYGEDATSKILALIDDATRVLSISFVEWIDGFRYDLDLLGDFCHKKGIVFVVDSIQGVGAMKLDVQSSRISFLSNGGFKWLMSPNGTGFIYVDKNILPKIDMKYLGYLSLAKGPMDFDYDLTLKEGAKKFRLGSINDTGIAAMEKSLELILDLGIEKIQDHILNLISYACEKIKSKGYAVLGDFPDKNRSGILSFRGESIEEVYEKLVDRNVIVSFRKKWIRISPHFYNTIEDMDRLLEWL
ncbi:MAG: aminotransferase class V-fold PLP-dependent enzyme [Candidatus Aminicenantes bacterium]|nr:aminotransferase class V-fold PLP-dependent enzyme [Candidatus Aminicenantes bacterium]